MNLNSKLPNTPTSIFAIMSKMSSDYNAINLSQGYPEFDVDQKLVELTHKAMCSGLNQYAPMQGVLSLRSALCDKIKKLYDVSIDRETEITVTAGATQAIYTAVSAVVHPGDEVIVIEPAYDSYIPSIVVNGGVPIFSALTSDEFSLDWDDLSSKVSPRTKMIMLNTPHNPTGSMLSHEDMIRLAEFAEKHDLIVLSDEVYEHLTYDGEKHRTALAYPKLKERTFACYSFGKVFNNTGWKMGYCVAPKELMDEFRKVHQFNVFSCNHPAQIGLAEYLEDEDAYLSLGAFFEEKKKIFASELAGTSFNLFNTKGTYFQLLDYSAISDKGDFEFCSWLTKEIGVSAIPVSSFFHDKEDRKLIRMCFAKKEDTLLSATKKLKNL